MKILKETISKNKKKIELLGNENSKNILVIGVFHGDEPQGEYLINEYLKENDSKLLFIPCLNPDGKCLNTRQNANNVDLNRNFPTKNWIKSKDPHYFGGNEPASEIETKFMVEIIEEYKPKAILTIHSPYCVVNYDGDCKPLAEEISKIINYPTDDDIGYPTPGSFGTYCGKERNIPTITLELSEEAPVETLKEPMFKIFKLLETL